MSMVVSIISLMRANIGPQESQWVPFPRVSYSSFEINCLGLIGKYVLILIWIGFFGILMYQCKNNARIFNISAFRLQSLIYFLTGFSSVYDIRFRQIIDFSSFYRKFYINLYLHLRSEINEKINDLIKKFGSEVITSKSVEFFFLFENLMSKPNSLSTP